MIVVVKKEIAELFSVKEKKIMLERIVDFKNVCVDIATLRAPAHLYWLVAVSWIAGATFGRWFL